MPRLNTLDPAQTTGPVKAMLGRIEASVGRVPNLYRGLGNSPAALKAAISMSGSLSRGELGAADREAIYLAVSQLNDCHYCVSAHTKIAETRGVTENEILAFRSFDSGDPARKSLLSFVRRVVDTNGFVSDEDLTAVKEAGFSDGQIAEAIGYIGLATFTNLFNHVYQTELDFPPAPPLTVRSEER